MSGVDVVRAYHGATTHGGDHDRSRLVQFRPLNPANRPDPFKRYPGLEVDPLPPELSDELGRLLFYGGGVTRTSSASYFRTAMSAGNLHPVELYVVGADLSVRHYQPFEHGLTTLRPGGGPPVAIVITGIPWRTGWKYGERGWRHLYWDAGAIAANLLAVGPDARALVDFDDDALCRLLGLDGASEFPLAVITLGAAELDVPGDLPRLDVEVAPISPRPLEFPLVTEIQRATSEVFGPLPVHHTEKSPNLGPEPIEEHDCQREGVGMRQRDAGLTDAGSSFFHSRVIGRHAAVQQGHSR